MASTNIFAELAELLASEAFPPVLSLVNNTLADISANPQEWVNPASATVKGTAFVANLVATLPTIENATVGTTTCSITPRNTAAAGNTALFRKCEFRIRVLARVTGTNVGSLNVSPGAGYGLPKPLLELRACEPSTCYTSATTAVIRKPAARRRAAPR